MIKDKLIKSILEYLNNPNDIEVACEDESYSKRLMNFILSDSQKKIEKLFELLENGNLDNETSAALKWAIFELENIYCHEE